jgi:uncharacterized membrane protein YtjA (UPF0391 family)
LDGIRRFPAVRLLVCRIAATGHSGNPSPSQMSSRTAPASVRHLLHDGHLANEPLEACVLSWALLFLILSLVAALFGFGGIAVSAAGIAKFLFFLFLVLFVLSLSLRRRPSHL